MTPSLNNLDISYSKLLLLIWGTIAILLVIVYWPSLHGPLIFDDIQNIVENPLVAIKDLSYNSLKQAFLSNESGLFKRVLPALSFGVNHYMAGGFIETLPYKLTNLIIHIINSGLLICFVSLLWPRFKFSGHSSRMQIGFSVALVSFLWTFHPLQVSTVAYVVQRMTSMAALFMLLGLCLFVYGRQVLEQHLYRGLTYMAIGVIGGTVLGLLNKENAALVSCYAAVIEFSLYKRKHLLTEQKRFLYAFYFILLVLPASLALFYYFIYPGNLSASYAGRPFTLAERLWTESRVLWFYLKLLWVPDITSMGLFHDDIAVSHGWLQPVSTLVSVIAWAVMIVLAVLMRHRLPLFTFALFWYLVGHSMESSFLPLELVYEHRNYMPSIGVIIFIAYIWLCLCKALFKPCKSQLIQRYALIAVCVILIFSLMYMTWSRANYWSSEKHIFTSIGINHPESAISQYLYGEVLFITDNKPLQAFPHYFKAAQLNPGEVAFLVMAALTTPAEVMKNLQDSELKQQLSNATIVSLILNKPLSPWSLTIFDAAAKCVLARQRHCLAHVPDVVIWLQAVLKTRFVAAKYKRQYIQQLYNIQMLNGMYQPALNTIVQAIATYGRAFQYFLMQADALQALGQYQEALAVLKEAEAGVRGRREDLLRKVQHMQGVITQKYLIQQKSRQ